MDERLSLSIRTIVFAPSQDETFASENAAQNRIFTLGERGFGIIEVMKSFIFFAAIFLSHRALADSLQNCEEIAQRKPQQCFQKASDAIAKSNAAAQGISPDCLKPAGQFDVVKCSKENGNANLLSKGYYSSARIECDQYKAECKTACSNVDPKNMQTKANEANRLCKEKIETIKKDLEKGEKSNTGADKGSEKTGSEAKGDDKPANNSTPPAGMPPTSPKSEDEKKEEPQTQQQPAAAPAATPPQQPEEKKGKAGLDDEKTKEQSAGGACQGAKFMCAGCPAFIAKCPGGNAQSCMSKWSDGDRQNYNANCGGAGDTSSQALTNPATPQSLSSASPMSAGGGGQGSTVSGGANTQAMLDDGTKNAVEDRAGHKEGGSMGVESAGGGGGGGGDSFGSNPFGSDDGMASHGLAGLAGAKGMSGLSNAFQASQDSRMPAGVLDRTGPNLFSIHEAAFQERCKRNLLFNCPNRK